MREVFIKKYWAEENILFYVHFQDGRAVRQIEVTPNHKVFLSTENPIEGEFSLYDQSLDDLQLDQKDFITAAVFESVWGKR
ncbi:hypothetical protein LZZ85_03485 [Terrimonas sp. NA20]|uniref:Uncharacterized protein n=1 Tax=Terrimonas ginsenosidimutans TaxID=2908004 RepID=A0ABS9KLX2_9BACT|nr:hypothetical protein [Terrimonas ginsenosidimutans]MCG2613322.1 hypothetical protein [Terrimonas ginsenosidimutans]